MPWIVITIALFPRIVFAGDDLQSEAKAHLEEVRRLEEIAAQKTENDVWMALRQSQRLAATDPAQAIDALRALLAGLDQDPYLSPARRDSLSQKIKVRIRQIERVSKQSFPAKQTTTATTATTAPSAAPTPRHRPVQEDPAAIRTAMQEVNILIKAGKTAEAKYRLTELEQRFPDNAAIAAARRLIFNNEVTKTSREIQLEAEARTGAQILDMTRSSTPPASEYELPKDWAEKTKKRSAVMQLTDKERSILAGLNKTVTIQVQNAKFENVIQQISDQIHQPILVDKAALAEAQISYDTTTISDQLPGVSARTALRKLLGEFGLTYVIKDQAIQVTSTQKARDMMIVRSYYIGDLLGNGGIGGALALAQTPVSQLQVAQQVKQVIDMIQASIEPMSWKESGGLGTITFHAPASSLVIKQSAEVHAMLAEGGLRP
jgi:hypothetical protein